MKFCKLHNITPKNDSYLGKEFVTIYLVKRGSKTNETARKHSLQEATKKTRGISGLALRLRMNGLNSNRLGAVSNSA